MQREIAAGIDGATGALAQPTFERAHRDVVGYENAAEPDIAANDGVDHLAGKGCRRGIVDFREDDMRGHRPRHRRQRAERREVAVRQDGAGRLDAWQALMAVDPRAAMSGDMLDDR